MTYVAGQVSVAAEEFDRFPWVGRSVKAHRAQIRQAFGFRERVIADEAEMSRWPASEVCPVELAPDGVVEALLIRCRALKIEPPAATRVERVVGGARATFEAEFCDRTTARLAQEGAKCLSALVDEDGPDGRWAAHADPRADDRKRAGADARGHDGAVGQAERTHAASDVTVVAVDCGCV